MTSRDRSIKEEGQVGLWRSDVRQKGGLVDHRRQPQQEVVRKEVPEELFRLEG